MIAEEVVRSLIEANDIETENENEVRLDLESVLKEFVRLEREITEEAKNRMDKHGLSFGQLGRIKAQVAKERGAPSIDDPLPYVIDQMLEILFHSPNVDEVFSEDGELRKKIAPVLRKHMDVESDLDKEVRSKIKNLQEGTANFEIEYAKVLEQMKRKRGLT